ncbi:hypothetical protein Daus18300_008996 [Diaporthe australafricana]|uniref:Uncharacterized protein n=1 Tax=Diaporthe australafricana TaxID=127596 RepID=A0ABR3WGE3_9PEZI
MAPVSISARLPAALIDYLAPREPQPLLRETPPRAVPGISGRFHSLPTYPSKTVRTALDAPSRVLLAQRDTTTSTIPGAYPGLNDGPDAGEVVGITLGSVGGFLLLLWLVYTCLSIGNRRDTISSYGTASVVTRKSRRRHSKHHHRSPSRRETVETVRTSRVNPVPEPPPERIVMEETMRRTSGPMPGPPPPMAAPPPPRFVPPQDDTEDEVVVIEEHSPPPRRHKTKSHRRRSSSARRESGFREVDPDRFGGGDAPLRDVRRSSRHGR